MAKRGNHPVNLADALIFHSLGTLNEHPHYPAAKAGDFDAALLVVDDLLSTVDLNIFKPYLDQKATLLPVLAQEAQGRNKIPLAIALYLENQLGLKVELGIGQLTKVSRTTLSGLDRVFVIPEFSGTVLKGQSYVLLDDTLTQGGTFAALASHLQQQNASVLGAVALTGKQYSARLKLDLTLLEQLRHKHGELEEAFQTINGYNYAALTQSEARMLVNFKPAEQVKKRILTESHSLD
ncbi:phosphoribosyltransferase [Thiolinea disciformis]|uniref:phosphoribosyltransferase n=1 Tax=Thiolinea disciformis TaxID=125614 RepID=UPI00036E74D8|nr:phosphoribosyltransferase [Thiolinea disciformis]